MCGIAGVLGRGPAPCLDAMTDALAHRGPDDRGTWSDPDAGVHLGHRRLAIIDLSPAGHQPMRSADGRFTVVYNGEMYNYQELRAELEASGARFHSGSDTEVLLAAAEAWGVAKTLERMVGMFAFALWDAREGTLTLARDRFGEKPLHYAWLDGQLAFASEIKAIEAHPAFRARVDRAALELYVRYGYVPVPRTIYEGVRKLSPGTSLTLRPGEAPGEPVAYWSARASAEAGLARRHVRDDEAVDAVERVLRAAVKRATVADVPVGVFLSGGIDSTLVTALLQAQSERPVRTFTIGFKEPGFDESSDARAVAAHLGTKHTEFLLEPEQAREVIPLLPTLYDEPFADSSQIPTYLVSKLARGQVTVALSGDGGDELFGGYNRHVLAAALGKRPGRAKALAYLAAARGIRALPERGWDRLARVAARLPLARARRLGRVPQPGARAHKLARAMEAHARRDYISLVSLWPAPEEVVRDAPGARDPRLDGVADALESEAEREMLLDAVSYLPDDVLVKVDRASMAVALETRAPLLAQDVFEVAWRLPLSMRVRDGRGKWALREVLARHVPKELTDRPKAGFAVPLAAWLRGPLRAWAEALLDEERLRREGWFHPEPIRRAWREHLEGRRDASAQLWVVLSFQAWLEARPHLRPA